MLKANTIRYTIMALIGMSSLLTFGMAIIFSLWDTELAIITLIYSVIACIIGIRAIAKPF